MIGFVNTVQANAITEANAARGTVTCQLPVDCGPLRAQTRTVNGVIEYNGGVAAQNIHGNGATVTVTGFGNNNIWQSFNSTQTASGLNTATQRIPWVRWGFQGVNTLSTNGTAR